MYMYLRKIQNLSSIHYYQHISTTQHEYLEETIQLTINNTSIPLPKHLESPTVSAYQEVVWH